MRGLARRAGARRESTTAPRSDRPSLPRKRHASEDTPSGKRPARARSTATRATSFIDGAAPWMRAIDVMTDASTGDLFRGVSQGLLEPIDWDAINPHPIFDEARHEFGIGTSYYSTIMAWRDDAKAPSNWVEFFDTENFPGKRALPDYPDFILAFAAMGDGVEMDDLFPLDLDRAFKTLERIKDDTICWQAGAQAPQLLQDNEAQYAISWSGRVAGQDGITVSFNQGMLDMSWFVMAKGTPDAEKEAAWLWLRDHTDAQLQACVAQYISYPGPSPDLEPLLPQDRLHEFPTYSANKEVQWLVDGQWWFENAAEIERRWNEFKLSL